MLKVFLTGGENIGWALDEDLRHTRYALDQLPELITFTNNINDADVVHSVWPLGIKKYTSAQLVGKRVIVHLPNSPFEFFKTPASLLINDRIGCWISQSRMAHEQLLSLGLQSRLIPYATDSRIFSMDHRSHTDSQQRQFERSRIGIPDKMFVIGSFQRDSEGADLTKPKLVKGPDILLSIVHAIHTRGHRVCVLLAGPRRHWLRQQLQSKGIPYIFIGKPIESDDLHVNILGQEQLAQLYSLLDLYVVSSRAEGGPRAVLEAAAMKCPIISTHVGLAPDVLEAPCLYFSADQAIKMVDEQIQTRYLTDTLDAQHRRIFEHYVPDANVPLFRTLYEEIDCVPVYTAPQAPLKTRHERQDLLSQVPQKLTQLFQRLPFYKKRSLPISNISVGMWYTFKKPPYGGGNQFFLALKKALEELGVTVHVNRFSSDIDVYLLNSTWFDTKRFAEVSLENRLRVIHRIDGPTFLVRGTESRSEDEACFDLNSRYANATVVQSKWSLQKTIDMGYMPVNPIIVHNGVDESIFHCKGRIESPRNRKIRLIASSWSDNPRKGGPIYQWLDKNLDFDRYDFTFVGRTQESFTRIRHIPAVPSQELADILRQHDIYITASQSDPCSNALIEALACGLPALYLDDGGHPELVGQGGLGFTCKEDIISQLDRLTENYELFQSLIVVPSILDVACKYLAVAEHLRD